MRILPPSLAIIAVVIGSSPAQSRLEEFKFELETLGGQTVSHEQYRDAVLIVDLWGTWCPPCRAAIPELVKLYAKYKHHGLEVVGLNYERGGNAQTQSERVRSFAIENGITYPLALGDEATRNQVPNFGGYPTMLMFKRGLKHDKTKVGFGPGDEKVIEKWIREALGLDMVVAIKPGADVAEGAETLEVEEPEPEPEPEAIPEGKIYRPGESDKGFEFEVEDADGNTITFSSMRGKPVVLALTSTWDDEAVATAKLMTTLQERYSGVPVLAACIERDRDRERKLAAISEFRKKNSLTFTLFPANLAFGRKLHKFAGLPTMLVFDAHGTLVLRELGSSDEIRKKIVATLDRLTGANK